MGSVDLGARGLGDAGLLAVGRDRRAQARRLLVLGVDERHVGDVDGAGPLDDADLGVRVERARALVALLDVQPVDVDLVLLAVHADDAAGLATVLAADHDDLVVAADPQLAALALHQRTSGARETIFMNPPSRSSRATGPKMRVPRGLLAWSMITAAFSSKPM